MVDELTADDVMDRTAVPILEYGRGWMLHADTIARSAELGLDGPFGFWVNGRAGVLGDADADVAAAAIGFMAPAMVRHHWETPTDLSRRGLSAEYAASAAAWGRNVLADLADTDLDRLTELCDRIADAALPSTGALFAGWRSVERPDDASRPRHGRPQRRSVSCAVVPTSRRCTRSGSDRTGRSCRPTIRSAAAPPAASGSAGPTRIRHPIPPLAPRPNG